MSPSPTRVVFATGRIASNTLRYRVRMAEELLRSRGIATVAVHSEDPLLTSWVESADLLVVYRAPANRRLLAAVDKARQRGIPVTFDVDDLVFLPSMLEHVPFLEKLSARQRQDMADEARLQELMLGLVDACTGATTPLVEVLRTVTDAPCQVLPNGLTRLGAGNAAATRRRADDGRLRLGYFAGSATHDEDWSMVEADVADLMRRHDFVDLVIVGPLRTGPALEPVGDRVARRRPVPWPALPQLIADVDLNLAPLAGSPFTEGKSALKWVEAAAVGTPTVASDTVPFREAIVDGVTGLLVDPDSGWASILDDLVLDAGRLRDIGSAARVAVLDQFGPEVQADRYESFVRRTITSPRMQIGPEALQRVRQVAPRPGGIGAALEPYPFPDDVSGLTIPAASGAAALDRLRVLGRRQRARASRIATSGRRLRSRAARAARFRRDT